MKAECSRCNARGFFLKIASQDFVVNAQFQLYAGIATIYARYKLVEKLSADTRVVSPHLNKAALVVGMFSCLGMCVVATFQVCLLHVVHILITWKKNVCVMFNGVFFYFLIAGNNSDSSS